MPKIPQGARIAFCSGPAAGIRAQIRSSPTANPQVSATRLLRICDRKPSRVPAAAFRWHPGTPSEVTAVFAFVALDDASFAVGAEIIIDAENSRSRKGAVMHGRGEVKTGSGKEG